MTQEALKLSQEALAGLKDVEKQVRELVAENRALKEALAQTQEPVAWAEFDGEGGYHFLAYENNEDYAEQWDKRNPNHVGWVKPLYTTPPQRTWVGLTDEEIAQGCKESWVTEQAWQSAVWWAEAKLKEKNCL